MNRLSRAAAITAAVLTMAGLAGCGNVPAARGAVLAAASAHSAPTLRQVSVKASTRYGLLWTVRAVVARSDGKSVKGLRVCIEQRTGRRIVDLACGALDSKGAYLAKLYQAQSAAKASASRTELRVWHPAGNGFGSWTGAWTH